MATITPKKPTLAPASTAAKPTPSASDEFAAQLGKKYLIVCNNGHTASTTMTIDDPTTTTPQSAKAFDPDVDCVFPNGQESAVLIDNPGRFINSSGKIVLNWSVLNATITYQVFEI